jgi:hypothetical protein
MLPNFEIDPSKKELLSRNFSKLDIRNTQLDFGDLEERTEIDRSKEINKEISISFENVEE